jgi:hypothetical protein
VTLADRIAEVLETQPLPVCDLATTVRKQKAEVIAALNGNPDRFVHNGMKARASRWSVRESVEVGTTMQTLKSFTVDELAARWGDDLAMGQLFVRDFLAAGYLEAVNGNGCVRVTERGRRVSRILIEARS